MPMSTVMTDHHKHCDQLFAQCEEAVANDDWSQAAILFDSFNKELIEHIDIKEESILFPEVEKQLGPIGPIMVMKQEHEQMRKLSTQLSADISAKNKDSFLGLAESLMILIQQHNMKEEQILYPLIQQHIPNADELIL